MQKREMKNKKRNSTNEESSKKREISRSGDHNRITIIEKNKTPITEIIMTEKTNTKSF